MINATEPIDVPTEIAIVRPLTEDCSGVATELDVGPTLDVGLKFKVDLRLRLSTTESVIEEEAAEAAAVDNGILVDGEEDSKEIDVAMPGFDPIENTFIALTPEQQEPLYLLSIEPVMSQHINPPSAAHLFEQLHIEAPPLLKSSVPAPVYSSVF